MFILTELCVVIYSYLVMLFASNNYIMEVLFQEHSVYLFI